ncbi:MAG: BMP family ABC transporter substrate-binding protein [Alphaproteobacteria bacterium]|nr:BMP family ABC transporter substrate-binding protein [Alphaproteobacteria bacterium]
MKNHAKLLAATMMSLGLTLGLAISQPVQAADASAQIGFVYVSPVGDAGWTAQHDMARKEMEKAMAGKVTTKFVENVPEGADAERVIREFAQNGAKVIFTTSFGFMNPTEKIAKLYPNITFMHATGYKSNDSNFGNYNARFYEGRYLNGVIAGRVTKSNILGYVAAFPIPEVIMGINAFTRGAQSVNPKAEVRVIWVNSWFDPGKEKQAADTLISQDADILTHHTDSTAVVQAAEANYASKKTHAFSYHSDMSKYAPRAQLSGTVHEWGQYYTNAVNQILAGKGKPANVWGGMKENMIRIVPMSSDVPKDVQAMVNDLAGKIKAGTFHPFTGPVVDQAGKTRVPAGTTISDGDLNDMNYYVKGVASKYPSN